MADLKLTVRIEANTKDAVIDALNEAATRIKEGFCIEGSLTNADVEFGAYKLEGEEKCQTCLGTKEVTTDVWNEDAHIYEPTGTGPCPDCAKTKAQDDEPSQDK